jgi:hypothetical protein
MIQSELKDAVHKKLLLVHLANAVTGIPVSKEARVGWSAGENV